jgi:indole-3-glycerol phosphate synthase
MSILDRIFATKREEVEQLRQTVSIEDYEAGLAHVSAPRGFLRALQRAEDIALIAEIKKASPSQGLIREHFDPVEIAKVYEAHGAACLSVLTDSEYFRGNLEYLEVARDAVTIPALRKDFIFDPIQVYQARTFGADAVLLIVAMLEDDQISELQNLIWDLGMDALVEVHTEEETARAIDLGCNLIGVNNRDLSTFTTDLSVSERLIPMITPFAFAVSESSVESRADVDRVKQAGAGAVLIGTRFTSQEDIGQAVDEVMSLA